MRKENSTFNMKYLSQPGVNSLHNNDYFGCSELDEFACYVVADGLLPGNSKKEDPSARIAVEAVIAAFYQNPSMGRRAIVQYIQAAHKVLRENPAKKKLKASITVVVTDYQKLRYGYAGNSRFHLYRGGKLIRESRDHSLSWEMMEEDQLPKDRIAYHEERNNLTTYLGQVKSFSPTVSRKLKLKNNDIFSLFTRGVWENTDNSDMQSAIKFAENDPEAAVHELERLILDDIPVGSAVENYTTCFVFIDKVFRDPKKNKHIKMIILISVIVLVVAAVIILLVVWRNNKRADMRSNMETAYLGGIEYTQGNNFVRANTEFNTAYSLATDLKDRTYQTNIGNYQKLVEAVIYADDLLLAEDFELALDAYRAAGNQSRYADNLAMAYIEKKLDKTTGYINVHDYINLGDTLSDSGDYTSAEQKYLLARSTAASIYYSDGKQEAVDALNALYEKMQEEVAAQQDAAQSEVSAAEFIIEGDNALRDGDLVGAKLFYRLARDKYEALGSEAIVATIDEKLSLVDVKNVQNDYQTTYAADYVTAGDEMLEQAQYVDAKRFYLLAREIYANLGDTTNIDAVQVKIDIADVYLTGTPVSGTASSDLEA